MRWLVNATPRPFYPREPGWTPWQVRKISPTPGFDPRTVQPVASRYTDWAIAAHVVWRFLSDIEPSFSVVRHSKKDPSWISWASKMEATGSFETSVTTNLYSWFQTFAVFCMLYAFFWVIIWRLNFICRRFGTLCLSHVQRQVIMMMEAASVVWR